MSKNNNFIQRSIMGALSFLKESIFADEYALRHGFLQSLDPRIKSVTFILFILQILFTKSLLVLLCLYALCLILTQASRINLGVFLEADLGVRSLVLAFCRDTGDIQHLYPGRAVGCF